MASLKWVRSSLLVLGVTLALSATTVAILVIAFGMRIEMTGNGLRPAFLFDDPEEHFSQLEENRAQHYSHLLPAASVSYTHLTLPTSDLV